MRGGTYATSATVRPLVDGVVLRLFDAKRTDAMGCVSHRILRLYARWRSPRQETILRRSDFMLSLTRAWSSSLRVGRLSNDTPRPRTKSCPRNCIALSLRSLLLPGLRVASDRHTQPQAKGQCHRRLRGGTYATSATLRPLVGGVVLRISDCETNRENGLRFVSNPPAIRLMA